MSKAMQVIGRGFVLAAALHAAIGACVMTLVPELGQWLVVVGLAVGFTACGFLLGMMRGVPAGREIERREADAKRDAWMRQLTAALRDERRAEREAIAELCAILGPREVE